MVSVVHSYPTILTHCSKEREMEEGRITTHQQNILYFSQVQIQEHAVTMCMVVSCICILYMFILRWHPLRLPLSLPLSFPLFLSPSSTCWSFSRSYIRSVCKTPLLLLFFCLPELLCLSVRLFVCPPICLLSVSAVSTLPLRWSLGRLLLLSWH